MTRRQHGPGLGWAVLFLPTTATQKHPLRSCWRTHVLRVSYRPNHDSRWLLASFSTLSQKPRYWTCAKDRMCLEKMQGPARDGARSCSAWPAFRGLPCSYRIGTVKPRDENTRYTKFLSNRHRETCWWHYAGWVKYCSLTFEVSGRRRVTSRLCHHTAARPRQFRSGHCGRAFAYCVLYQVGV